VIPLRASLRESTLEIFTFAKVSMVSAPESDEASVTALILV
jgi:hypothetical protein